MLHRIRHRVANVVVVADCIPGFSGILLVSGPLADLEQRRTEELFLGQSMQLQQAGQPISHRAARSTRIPGAAPDGC